MLLTEHVNEKERKTSRNLGRYPTDEELEALRRAMIEAHNVISVIEEAAPHIDKAVEALRKGYDAIWQLYRRLGAPYGETGEGMIRFYEECDFFQTPDEREAWEKLRERFRDIPLED
jgi:hypothetical protein